MMGKILLLLSVCFTSCLAQDSTAVSCTWSGFSPDGKLLGLGIMRESFHDQKLVKVTSNALIYATENGQLIRSIQTHQSRINSIAFHPRKTCIVTCSNEANSIIWDYSTGAMIDTLDRRTYYVMSKAAFNKEGNLLATYSFGAVRIWDFEKRKLKYTLRHEARSVSNFEFSDDGKYIETYAYVQPPPGYETNFNARSLVWELSTGRFLKTTKILRDYVDSAHQSNLTHKYIAYAPDSVEYKGKELFQMAKTETGNYCACRNFLAVDIGEAITVWDPASYKQTGYMQMNQDAERIIAFNCNYLVTTKDVYALPGFQKVTPPGKSYEFWDIDDFGLLLASDLKMDPAGKRLAYLIRNKEGATVVKVAELPSGNEVFSVPVR